jgi:uncharacterized protein YndB with AHSA1/START domain
MLRAMPAYPLRSVDDQFLRDAPLVVASTVKLDAPPTRVWQALGSDEMWSWLPLIDQLAWQTPRPHTEGAVRRLRLGRFLTVDEEFYRWETDSRATFRITHQSRKVLDALIEDFVLHPAGTGTELTWTMAVSPLKGRGLPLGLLAPLLKPGNTAAIAGIKKILR